MQPPSRNATAIIVQGALVAGTLDIAYAIGFWAIKAGVAPMRILQSVAAGALGDASFAGGIGTASFGLVLHYLIVFAMVGACFLLARRWPRVRRQPFLFGARAVRVVRPPRTAVTLIQCPPSSAFNSLTSALAISLPSP